MLEKLARLLPWRTEEEREMKAAGGSVFAIEGLARAAWTPRDYAMFARDGMMRNAVVYRAVRMVSEAAVPLLAYSGDDELEAHGLIDLLARPQGAATGTELLETIYGHLLVAGNAYIDSVALGGRPSGLHVLRPDRVRVVADSDSWPEVCEYSVGTRRTTIRGEVVTGVPRLLHLKLFHPVNDHYWLSLIEAAATAVDVHNTASRWNKALLDNAARPSGALVYTAGGHLTADQFDRLKGELEENFQGARNAGRPLLLEGGLDWKAMSLSPRDMDFIEVRNAAVRDIGHASFAETAHAFAGLGRRPLSPVHVSGRRSGDDLEISWIRRTREGGDNWDVDEVPLGEESERYEVDILDGAAVVRTLATTTPGVIYSAAEQTADFGTVQAAVACRVYQLSQVWGRGAPREAVV